jgi:hypothetical protein
MKKVAFSGFSGGTWFFANLRSVPLAALAIIPALLTATPPCLAQSFPPQDDDTTVSMGVFIITVDPAFYPLVNAGGGFSAYTGYNPLTHQLTSPVLYDGATTIGRSDPHPRPTPFPAPIGAGSWDIINGYGDYSLIPALWAGAPLGDHEVLTEIKSLVLSTEPTCANDPRVPSVPINWPMLKAGTFAGVSPRSLGIVQTIASPGPPDFPARSFFDVFMHVDLPPVPGTMSAVAFPPAGAPLYNDPADPLIVQNLALNSFPPQVIYIHGLSGPGIPLRFRSTHPPYWTAGDIFGYLVLAGHGTFPPGTPCSSAAAVSTLLNTTLVPYPTPPCYPLPPYLCGLCPVPGSSYISIPGTNFGGQTIDLITFTNVIGAGGTLYARNFVHYNLINPIQPPLCCNPVIYTNPITRLSLEVSLDGTNWTSAQGGGPVAVQIINTNPTASSTTVYQTKLQQLDITGDSQFGSFLVRLDPTIPSIGQHIVELQPRGCCVYSFFDVFLQLSLDLGQTWHSANRSIRVQPTAPPAVPNSIFVSSTAANGLVLNWLGSFNLLTAPTVNGPWATMPGVSNGPVTIPPNATQRYFRLSQ